MTPGSLSLLERSYWVHASLGATTQNGYWGWGYRETVPPGREEVRNAARLLVGEYGANRLYLVYHREIPEAAARRLFRWWREALPTSIELVPTLVLRMYDPATTPLFSRETLRPLVSFFQDEVNAKRIGVYDILPDRHQGAALGVLAGSYRDGLLRVGLQPGERLPALYSAAVEDTWSAMCHGKSHADWEAPDFGRDTLRSWVEERNRGSAPVAWDLVTVAWDYAATQRGEYPGYDDADKNMPLPEGRTPRAAREILERARREVLAGFSSDLFILHVNSASRAHDGPTGAFYETLKRGRSYRGYYGAALGEVAGVYRSLRDDRAPSGG